jgi:hypothetical protein
MKASVFAMLALCATAGTAMANTVGYVIGYEPITGEVLPQTRASNSVVFSAMTPNAGVTTYSAFAAATGAIGNDDYNSTLAGGNAFLQSMRFIGGLTAAGTMRIEFYDSSAGFVNSFNVNLPAGNNIWTIGLESVAGAKDSTFLIPEAGIIQLVATGGVTGQFFLANTAPTVGTQNYAAAGTYATFSHRFELTIPAPGAMALLGLGGLMAARRRR